MPNKMLYMLRPKWGIVHSGNGRPKRGIRIWDGLSIQSREWTSQMGNPRLGWTNPSNPGNGQPEAIQSGNGQQIIQFWEKCN